MSISNHNHANTVKFTKQSSIPEKQAAWSSQRMSKVLHMSLADEAEVCPQGWSILEDDLSWPHEPTWRQSVRNSSARQCKGGWLHGTVLHWKDYRRVHLYTLAHETHVPPPAVWNWNTGPGWLALITRTYTGTSIQSNHAGLAPATPDWQPTTLPHNTLLRSLRVTTGGVYAGLLILTLPASKSLKYTEISVGPPFVTATKCLSDGGPSSPV